MIRRKLIMSDFIIDVVHVEMIFLIIGLVPVAMSWSHDRLEAVMLVVLVVAEIVVSYYWLIDHLPLLSSSIPAVHMIVAKLNNFSPLLFASWESISVIFSTGAGALSSWGLLLIFAIQKGGNKHIRGALLLSKSEIKRKIKLPKGKVPINIGGIPIPFDKETRPVGLSGEPGVGKTQMLMLVIEVARKRGERGFCVDAGGDLLNKFWKEDDVILAFDDSRSVDWSPFSEINDVYDCTSIASAFISLGTGSSAEWNKSARKLTADILRSLWISNKRKNGDFQHYIFYAKKEELFELLKGTPSERLFDEGSEKMLSNILSIVSTKLAPFEFIDSNCGECSFSIKKWVKNEAGNNWLWLTFRDNSAESLMPFRRAWIDIFIRSVMELIPDFNRRIWGMFDEVASSGQLDSLKIGVSRGRKYGLAIYIGYQNLAQLYDIYGNDAAKSIISSLGHSLVLRTPDPDTADFISRSIGDAEIERIQINLDGKKNISSRQKIIETRRVVLPSEIMGLPDLEGYLKIAGIGWTSVSIPFVSNRLRQKTKSHIPVLHKEKTEEPDMQETDELDNLVANQLDEI